MIAEAKFIKKRLIPVKNLADLSRTTVKELTNIKSAEEDSEEEDNAL
jgi:hypothetical protein